MTTDEEYLNNLLRSVTAGLEIDGLEDESEVPLKNEDSPEKEEALGNEETLEEEVYSGNEVSSEEEESMEAGANASSDFDANLDEISSLLQNAEISGSMDDFLKFTDVSELEDIPNLSDMRNVSEEQEEESSSPMDEPFFVGEDAESTEIPFEMETEESEKKPEESEKEKKKREKEEAKTAKRDAKKAQKEAKRAEKEAKKAEIAEKKAQRKSQKGMVKEEAEGAQETWNETGTEPDSGADALEGFQEVNEFDDIGALFESMNAENFGLEETQKQETNGGTDDGENAEVTLEETVSKEKKSLLKRFIDFLMEEDEEEEVKSDTREDGEKKEEGKKEKKKKQKDKKKAKGDKEGDEEGEKQENKQNKKKEKKEKKKKTPAPETEIESRLEERADGKKIGKNSIIAAVLLAVSLFAVIMLSNSIFSPILAKQRAQEAFNQQDYETCYQELFGWKLNSGEKNMQAYCLVVLKLERRLDAYTQYKEFHLKTEALDALLKAVQNYDDIYQEALNCGAEKDVEDRYFKITAILEEEYGLTEKEARRIVALSSDEEYTRCLNDVIKGNFDFNFRVEEELPELLPEEEELPDTNFFE